jgi:hypothetical protein
MTEETLTGEETVAGETETITAGVSEVVTTGLKKCTKLHVPTVELRLKFRSNLQKAGQFTVETAFQITENFNNNPTLMLILDTLGLTFNMFNY